MLTSCNSNPSTHQTMQDSRWLNMWLLGQNQTWACENKEKRIGPGLHLHWPRNTNENFYKGNFLLIFDKKETKTNPFWMSTRGLKECLLILVYPTTQHVFYWIPLLNNVENNFLLAKERLLDCFYNAFLFPTPSNLL